MKVQTKDLIDIALDWAVAKLRGYTEIKIFTPHRPTDRGWIDVRMNPDRQAPLCRYDPTLDWHYGGPIIEWEGIDLYCNVPSSVSEKNKGWSPSWRAKYHRCGVGSEITYGPTPLIAAMRCFCCAKLGDEVEIPQELQPCQQPNP